MKRKDLYNYIREEIINELSEGSVVVTPGSNVSDVANTLRSKGTTSPDAAKTATDTANKSGKSVTVTTKMAEAELDEMANIASILKMQDAAKLALAKEIYSTGRYADVLKAIEDAGEEGTTQKQLGQILGINDTILNPIINNLRVAGVLAPKRERMVKPEKPAKVSEPEVEPDTTKADSFYKADTDFDTPEEEPTAAIDKYAEELSKLNTQLSQLTAKKNEILKKYKDGDLNLDQYKAAIGTIPSQIKKIQDKIADVSKID